ncbi:MAG: hypothetical protein EXS31_17305 [Pedosphaera sp.]|nr:hypothetical protein [Pedosphaera sp.]
MVWFGLHTLPAQDQAAKAIPAASASKDAANTPAAAATAPAADAAQPKPSEKPASTDAAPEKAAPAEPDVDPLLKPTQVADAIKADDTTKAPGEGSDNRGPLTLDHELPAAIQFLARMANLNIHIDPSLTFTNAIGPDGRPSAPMVSVRWENVTAEDALQEVLDVNGLTLISNPRTKISRVTRKPTIAPLITSIVQLQYASPTNMVDMIKAAFTEPLRSKVTADNRTSQLMIVTTQRDFEAITNLIAKIDIPTKQVLIEARLLETAKNPKTVKGIDWTGTLEAQRVTFGNGRTTGTTATSSPGGTTTTTLPSGRSITGAGGQSTQTELTTALGNGGLSIDSLRGFHPATAFLNADGMSAVLSFLNQDNDTEVVATPRAVTSDNQMAKLEVTRAYPIFQITPGSANSPAGAQVTYTNVGTILRVTPRISAKKNIALKVVPEVSNIDSKDVQILNGARNEANVYAVRRVEADVVVPSGHTLVIGGLISDQKTKAYTKVPILGDLPGIGLAFRKESKQRNKSNLLIFITPTIVEDSDFQPTKTEFLHSKSVDSTDEEETAWDSGKPAPWNKGKKDQGKQ